MATRVNIDQRPRVMQFLGGTILMASLLYGTQSFLKNTDQFQQQVKTRMIQRTGEYNGFQYAGDCLKSRTCISAYFTTWAKYTPAPEMAFYLTGVCWGAAMVLVGSAWKPEMNMLRTTRMRSWAQFNLPDKSAVPPREP